MRAVKSGRKPAVPAGMAAIHGTTADTDGKITMERKT